MSEAWAAWVERDTVEVAGPGALSFLQGQLSQDLTPLGVGESAWSFILQPQGKVDALVRVLRTDEDRFSLDVDAGFGPAVMARLTRFKLRTKCEIVETKARYLLVRGARPSEVPHGAVVVQSGWGDPGYDLVGEDFAVPENVSLGDQASAELARIAAGFPAMGAELNEGVIPAESGVVPLAVSFTKGCFTGQELVARIDSRGGNVPRHLRLVRSEVNALPQGTSLRQGDDTVGLVTSSAWSPVDEVSLALAYVKRSVEVPSTLTLDLPGAPEAKVECIP